jgi:hypothetical protein
MIVMAEQGSIFDIVGYDYKGDRQCGVCITTALPTGDGEELEGYSAEGLTAEEFLQCVADDFEIDRLIPRSFSADQFPKVVFRGQSKNEVCDKCSGALA